MRKMLECISAGIFIGLMAGALSSENVWLLISSLVVLAFSLGMLGPDIARSMAEVSR